MGDPDNKSDFSGQFEVPGVSVRGVQASVEYIDHALCGGAGNSHTGDWVGIIRQTASNAILQVGFDKCKGVSCNPVSTVYYFYAYGRPAGTCGTAVGPIPQSLGIAAPGTPKFKIEFLPDQGNPNLYDYYLYIDSTSFGFVTQYNVDTCWGGPPTRADVMSEVLDTGTQIGGSTSNHQGFTDLRYKDSTFWRPINRTLSSPCDFVGFLNHMSAHCNTSNSNTDDFLSWDARF